MTAISFFIPGAPVAQPRQRHRIMQGKSGASFVSNYTPAKDPVNAFKAAARLAASAAWSGGPIVGPVEMNVSYLMPRPKNHYRTGKHAGSLKPDAPRMHTSKPDRDNLEKALKDALKGICWLDDSQVCDGRSQKLYALEAETPGVQVEIKSLEQQ